MKHIWSVLCLQSIVDTDTNSLTLYDCPDELHVGLTREKVKEGEKIIIPANFELVHLLIDKNIDKDRKFEIKIELYDPKDEKIGSIPGGFVFPKGKSRFRARMKIQGIPITSDGTYVFKVKIEGKIVAEIPLDIKIEWK